MGAYPAELHTRTVAAVEGGLAQVEVARRFTVNPRTVRRSLTQQRQTGDLAPRRSPGRTPRIGPAQAGAMRGQVAAHPDVTLEDHCELWAEAQGVAVSIATMSRVLRGFGITVNKTLHAIERDEANRATWRGELAGLDPADLVVVDESGTNLAITPRYGRAPTASGWSG
ncbi:MAG: hypothetical protein H0U40_12335 [Chloroflexia bacterium]|nr:hypothetical protein [Chloroflexia bacterium]